jgi:hypothetical protein
MKKKSLWGCIEMFIESLAAEKVIQLIPCGRISTIYRSYPHSRPGIRLGRAMNLNDGRTWTSINWTT